MGKARKTGQLGEDLAVSYLQQVGMRLLKRNFRHGRSEIDLIAVDGNHLVFLEVKTRTNLDFGMPETFLSDAQADRIREAATVYANELDWQGPIRFDIISVILEKGKSAKIDHFKDALT